MLLSLPVGTDELARAKGANAMTYPVYVVAWEAYDAVGEWGPISVTLNTREEAEEYAAMLVEDACANVTMEQIG